MSYYRGRKGIRTAYQKNKISIQDVENLALMLSRSSKRVTELQRKLPLIQQKLSQIKARFKNYVAASENF